MRLNLPNILASLRVIIAPILFLLLLIDRNNLIFKDIHYSWIDFAAALLFVVAAVTDFFDGYIARAWNQKTVIGGILDPLADKMLILASFLGLILLGRANPWAVYIILVREFFITGLRVAAASEGKEVAASMSGKVKTVFQMIAIGFLIMNWSPLAEILLWFSVILTLYSGFEYVVNYTKSAKKC
ncbi:MAG: CDP-diacylglycerol--glycerol-3-phosphate 3-phosphatidyltransferase [Campylobacteraceae bacterium]|jgi:CDP-diacylglycerol--glycerol-3-phosphate 3-phosphatidyltransferase|nr:CDP-diacylglycerol--glycerol-3-phosphate 3-phosphatidyltransferase [Campylobacteraceae bacterium]